MTSQFIEPASQEDLRSKALARLTGRGAADAGRASSSEALGVLFELASSPSTAADALALLHELQVHQVELELQEEELRSSRAEVEAALNRQIQLYDAAPAGSFTVDRNSVLCELNLTGARMLGFDRDALIGRAFDTFLAPHSGRELRATLERAGQGGRSESCSLQLNSGDSAARIFHTCIRADPAGALFLMACIDGGEPARGPAT